VPGPHVTAIPFAYMSGAIVPMVESVPRALRPCMMAVSFFGVLPCVIPPLGDFFSRFGRRGEVRVLKAP